MIYLASPYSHENPDVEEDRADEVSRIAAELIRGGARIFCPIAHSHAIAKHGLPGGWEFWEEYDREYLEFCDELIVALMDGWKDSKGVRAEIMEMDKLGKPVKYYDPATKEMSESPPEG
jgi:hypothetical protein